MSLIDLDLPVHRALELMERVVSAQGEDYVYQPGKGSRCVYVENDCPSCLIAWVLHEAGVPVRQLARLDLGQVTVFAALASDGIVRIQRDTAEVLAAAQVMQDKGDTWGVALATARATAATLKTDPRRTA